MLDTLKALVPKDKDLPERAWRQAWREEFRTDAIYDRLKCEFHQETEDGTESGDYVPLSQRRPSVRFGLPEIIVNDSTSLLFSEGHFPAIEVMDPEPGQDAKNEQATDVICTFAKVAKLREVLLEAAVRGSVGSIALWFRVLRSKVYIKALETTFLTPIWEEEAPDELRMVEERRKVTGVALIEAGYAIPDIDRNRRFWFVKQWTKAEEIRYKPWPVDVTEEERKKQYPVMERDEDRTVAHLLGFVPILWIKNLPGGDDIDGACTFEGALGSSIEIDYQLSQSGRGLKYSSDPTLVLKEAGISMGGGAEPVIKAANKAIKIGPNDDAFNLEISGAAVAAVENYVRMLREFAMERVGGNRSTPEKMSTAQSGRAMEMMNQGLIWLADKLRTSYGECGLMGILKMVLAANQVMELKIGETTHARGGLPKPEAVKIELVWPPWYALTAADEAAEATAVKTDRDAGVVSRETAVRRIAPRYDIEDVTAEVKRIEAEQQAQAEMESDNAIKLAKETAAAKPAPIGRAA